MLGWNIVTIDDLQTQFKYNSYFDIFNAPPFQGQARFEIYFKVLPFWHSAMFAHTLLYIQ